MTEMSSQELVQLGRRAAEAVAGQGTIERVEAGPTEDDLGREAYLFSFLVDPDRMTVRPGLFRMRLLQQLGDDLLSVGDEHRPAVKILNREDWTRQNRALVN